MVHAYPVSYCKDWIHKHYTVGLLMHKLSLDCMINEYHEQNYRTPKTPKAANAHFLHSLEVCTWLKRQDKFSCFYFFFTGSFFFFFSFFFFWTDWGHGEVSQDGLGNGRMGEALRIISSTQFSSFQDSIYMLGQAHVNATPGLPALPLKWIQCTVTPYHTICFVPQHCLQSS